MGSIELDKCYNHKKMEGKVMKVVNKKDIIVETWVRDWQREYRSFIKESTFATYSVAIENHILP